MSIASDKLVKECEEKMLKTIESVKERFTSIRAGRANVAMLDGVKVENYGSDVPLNQIGSVSAPEARLLVVDPWDKTLIPKIENTIPRTLTYFDFQKINTTTTRTAFLTNEWSIVVLIAYFSFLLASASSVVLAISTIIKIITKIPTTMPSSSDETV